MRSNHYFAASSEVRATVPCTPCGSFPLWSSRGECSPHLLPASTSLCLAVLAALNLSSLVPQQWSFEGIKPMWTMTPRESQCCRPGVAIGRHPLSSTLSVQLWEKNAHRGWSLLIYTAGGSLSGRKSYPVPGGRRGAQLPRRGADAPLPTRPGSPQCGLRAVSFPELWT